MGTRGPVPKRSSARAGHRTKAEQPDKAVRRGPVNIPPVSADWHPRAQSWYRSLAESGQSDFYESSDWELAGFVAQLMTEVLEAAKPSSELVKAILSAMNDLGVTEGARRRMRIEVERMSDDREESGVAAFDEYRRLEAAS
jgi:hypothetical protein